MEEALSQIIKYLDNYTEVSAAWLFGSAAAGKFRKGSSDIDIAVLFIPNLSKHERFDLRLFLSGELSELTKMKVDVIDMQSVPLYFQHQVRKTGRIIIEKDHSYRASFDVRSRREYFDLLPALELRKQLIIKKALGGK